MSWTLIEHQALSSSAASVTLGSGGTIPQTYKTLKLLISTRSSYAATRDSVLLTFNSTATGYSSRWLYGYDSNQVASATGGTSSIDTMRGDGQTATSNTFDNIAIDIPNYAGSTNKPVSIDGVVENNSSSLWIVFLTAGLLSNTAAITSIKLQPQQGPDFVSGSTFTLYGLA